MGINVDARIGYGVIPKNYDESPWMTGQYDYEIETWWLYGVLGFQPSVEIYELDVDDTWCFIGGEQPSEKIFEAYHTEKYEFLKKYPALPVRDMRYGFEWDLLHLLIVPSSPEYATRCSPSIFDPLELTVTESERNSLIDFCREYGVIYDEEPSWLLSFFYG